MCTRFSFLLWILHSFFVCSSGTFSTDPEILGLKTQISIPEILVTGPTSADYLEMFEDISSESSQILIGTINEIVR